jgi:hypothetical protein
MTTNDTIVVPDGTIHPHIDLPDMDGNAFSIIAEVAQALKRAGNEPQIVIAYRAQAMEGDYDHLLRVSMAFNGDFS